MTRPFLILFALLFTSSLYAIEIKVSSHTSSYSVSVDEKTKQIHYTDGRKRDRYQIKQDDYDYFTQEIKKFLGLDQKDKCDSDIIIDLVWSIDKNTLCSKEDVDNLSSLLRRVQLISKKL